MGRAVDESSDELTALTRAEMLGEARRIIDFASERGIVLRLFGGLAVRVHCKALEFCERDYADLDVVGLARQRGQITALMDELGYQQNVFVAQATEGRQLQFYQQCSNGDAQAHFFVHPNDHIDVFLDTFKMDHRIELKERLGLERYTISVSDTLLTKLQIFQLNEKDVRDIVTLLKDLPLAEHDSPGAVNLTYIAERCAHDWGLYHDVMVNLRLCRERAGGYGLSGIELGSLQESTERLIGALEQAPKSTFWRLRAKVGTRRPWHDEIEGQG